VTVQVTRCHNVLVFVNAPQFQHIPHSQGVLGGLLGAAIGSSLIQGDAKPYGAALGAIVGMQITQQASVNSLGTVFSVEPTYYQQHCGLSLENQLKVTIRGYQVSYQLDGIEHWALLDQRLLKVENCLRC
jgi:uncharacterized protein YcfJ